ncbi:MAG: D-sedoheptulose 7-phosphate isomerase [Flavobacteriales bacterium]|nr:D-sedoheptulose 7-phosphate isomerase [Flavobacteriales bacterium]MCB9449086.1 D-sedoheptulose 7-phosphate isomerase [Flavobacteriales bacterium]
MNAIRDQFEEASRVLTSFMNGDGPAKTAEAVDLIVASIRAGGKVLSCGNGGSMCDAIHFAEEMTGRFRNDRKPLPALAIADPGHLTCVANDYGFEEVFSRSVQALGRSGDILLAISTSGNSVNVIRAAEAARKQQIKIVGLTGGDGGKLAALCDVEIRAPKSNYADRAQEIHIKVIHALILGIEAQVG